MAWGICLIVVLGARALMSEDCTVDSVNLEQNSAWLALSKPDGAVVGKNEAFEKDKMHKCCCQMHPNQAMAPPDASKMTKFMPSTCRPIKRKAGLFSKVKCSTLQKEDGNNFIQVRMSYCAGPEADEPLVAREHNRPRDRSPVKPETEAQRAEREAAEAEERRQRFAQQKQRREEEEARAAAAAAAEAERTAEAAERKAQETAAAMQQALADQAAEEQRQQAAEAVVEAEQKAERNRVAAEKLARMQERAKARGSVEGQVDSRAAERFARQREKEVTGDATGLHVAKREADSAAMDPRLAARLAAQQNKAETGVAAEMKVAKRTETAAMDPKLAARLAAQQNKAETGVAAEMEVAKRTETAAMDPRLAARLAEQQNKAETGVFAEMEDGDAEKCHQYIADGNNGGNLPEPIVKGRMYHYQYTHNDSLNHRVGDILAGPCPTAETGFAEMEVAKMPIEFS